MPFELPKLPYAYDALAPVISAETIEYHYGKHHQTYVNNLNKIVEGTAYAEMSIEDICRKVHGQTSEQALFNNAAQVWNHTFYWNCMKPGGGGAPTGAALEAINRRFGEFESFKEQFSAAAAEQFGSGWAWLVKDGNGVAIETTSNAGTPMATGKICLLTIDVWEHAYYIDYRNARPKYIEDFWKLVNWDFVNSKLS
jgi:superoxide dismutase, Fe-Mn family